MDVTTNTGDVTPVDLVLVPQVAWFDFHTAGQSSSFSVVETGIHALGTGSFAGGDRAFVSPALCEVYVGIANADGKSINLVFDEQVKAEAGRLYAVGVSVDSEAISITVDGADCGSIRVDDDYFDSEAPTIEMIGFEPGGVVTATEGVTLVSPVRMDAESGSRLSHLYLSVESSILAMLGHSPDEAEVDLLNMTPEQAVAIADSHIVFDMSDDRKSAKVVFTKMIEELASLTSTRSVLRLSAVDVLGRMSAPVDLVVDTRTMSFEVVSVDAPVFGKSDCMVVLRPSLAGVEEQDMRFYVMHNGQRIDCQVVGAKTNADGTVTVTFLFPDMISEATVHFEYMGLERASFAVSTTVPDFTVKANPYATFVRLKVEVSTGDDARAFLTESLQFFDGERQCSVLERDARSGIIVVNGLSADTRYTLVPALKTGETRSAVTFTTEKALEVPDGDFENAKPSMIKYKGLPSGGRYAVTPFDIANRQNFVDIDIPWSEKYWTSINDKTFCIGAKHKNTWYMQPSTAIVYDPKSGSKAMCISSVGWDLDGEKIADYVPTSAVATPSYSLSVPTVRYRSAGRLFIGDYRFDASSLTETCAQGTPFTSRPSALNGFYKYTADQTLQSDRGYVVVRLVLRSGATETVVAEGRGEFVPAPDYTAFNVQLDYKRDDVQPSHLEIMFVSSVYAGDMSISDTNVPVTALPDRAAMTGSRLWVDNLSFAY